MNERLWILGAPDPEMVMIESLLRDAGETVVYATVDGERVHPGNAYRAIRPLYHHGPALPLAPATTVLVEC